VKAFFRLYDALIDALAWLCGAALAAVFVLIVVAVMMRILHVGEPDWILPVTEYAMLFVGTLGAPWLLREKGHVCVDIVRVSVTPRARRRLARIVAAGSLVLSLLLLYFTFPVLRATWGEHEMRAFLMPKPLLVAPIGVTFFLLAIGFLRALLGYSELYEDSSQPKTGEL
jgi:TRAP-type C4-dicarboxylate transport system permease small subunit